MSLVSWGSRFLSQAGSLHLSLPLLRVRTTRATIGMTRCGQRVIVGWGRDERMYLTLSSMYSSHWTTTQCAPRPLAGPSPVDMLSVDRSCQGSRPEGASVSCFVLQCFTCAPWPGCDARSPTHASYREAIRLHATQKFGAVLCPLLQPHTRIRLRSFLRGRADLAASSRYKGVAGG